MGKMEPKPMQGRKIGLYMRLSRDDEKAGESMSIEHQRIMLAKYVEESGGTVAEEYVDDGYSGTDFDRPAVKRLLSDAKEGKIDTIVVKDLSRFGRNYIQVGQYIDYLFPAYGIRFIALSDNVDTADRGSAAMDMMPIMNVFNEWHAANTSKKIRAVFEASRRAGKYTNWSYPYGYKAGEDEYRTAVIDEEAARVVRHIFDLRSQGYSLRAIGKALADEGIPNPATYFTKRDGSKSNRNCSPLWSGRTIAWILTNPVYLGRTTQHRTTSVSYKNHRVLRLPESEWIVKENAHEPIICPALWERVQTVNNSASRGRADGQKKTHLLSGVLVCPDCGGKFKLQQSRGGAYSFICRTYKDYGKKYCTSHHITEKAIEALVLGDLRSLLQTVPSDGKRAKEEFLRERAKAGADKRLSAEKQLRTERNRLDELDRLLKAAFEEKVLKGLPEEVCESLCREYRAERERTLRKIGELEKELAEGGNGGEAERYLEEWKRFYTGERFTREGCLQLIDHITVGQAGEDGGREIHIYYKFRAPVRES